MSKRIRQTRPYVEANSEIKTKTMIRKYRTDKSDVSSNHVIHTDEKRSELYAMLILAGRVKEISNDGRTWNDDVMME